MSDWTRYEEMPGVEPGHGCFMCMDCGSLRQARARFSGYRLKCAGECRRATDHVRVGLREDYREQMNRERDQHLRTLVATEAMLDALGIDLLRVPLEHMYAGIWSQVEADGTRRWGITLDAELSLEDQVRYLKVAWRDLLPLNDGRWADDDEWTSVRDEPDSRQLVLEWLKENAR